MHAQIEIAAETAMAAAKNGRIGRIGNKIGK
jgi:hypothetical protein